MQIRVDAPPEEVRSALDEALGQLDGSQLTVEEGQRDPFYADSRGEDMTFTAVVTWTALAAAGGVIGNVSHDGLKSAAAILTARFGKDRVHEEDDVPTEEDAA